MTLFLRHRQVVRADAGTAGERRVGLVLLDDLGLAVGRGLADETGLPSELGGVLMRSDAETAICAHDVFPFDSLVGCGSDLLHVLTILCSLRMSNAFA